MEEYRTWYDTGYVPYIEDRLGGGATRCIGIRGGSGGAEWLAGRLCCDGDDLCGCVWCGCMRGRCDVETGCEEKWEASAGALDFDRSFAFSAACSVSRFFLSLSLDSFTFFSLSLRVSLPFPSFVRPFDASECPSLGRMGTALLGRNSGMSILPRWITMLLGGVTFLPFALSLLSSRLTVFGPLCGIWTVSYRIY